MLTRRVVLSFSAACVLAASGALAQAPSDRIAPLEMLMCRFADGKGAQDLEPLARAFNEWMERESAPEYAAYALQPLAHSAEIDFDLAWVGVWPDGATMGASMAHYFARGAQLGPVFESVMSCDNNRNFAVLTLRPPNEPGRFGPLEVATCSLRIGATTAEAIEALRSWVEHTGRMGADAAHWVLFPAYGEHSDANYVFKWAVGYGSYESFGRAYDQFNNDGGVDKHDELFGPLLRCDSPRLYAVRPIRLPQR